MSETASESHSEMLARLSLSGLIRRMHSAADFGYDDEAVELSRRLRATGRDWRWTQTTPPRVELYDTATDPAHIRARLFADAATAARKLAETAPKRAIRELREFIDSNDDEHYTRQRQQAVALGLTSAVGDAETTARTLLRELEERAGQRRVTSEPVEQTASNVNHRRATPR